MTNQFVEELTKAFVRIVNEADVDDLPEVMNTVTNITANVIGCSFARKFNEACECKNCRLNAKEMLEDMLIRIDLQVRECLDGNMKMNDMEPLFGPTNHNERITKEILDEIEKRV